LLFACQRGNVDCANGAWYTPGCCNTRDGFRIPFACLAAQPMIEVRGMQLQLRIALPWPAKAVQEVQKAQRIRPTRNGDDDFSTGGEKLMFFNKRCDAL